jgi:hypothetical protein
MFFHLVFTRLNVSFYLNQLIIKDFGRFFEFSLHERL